MKYNDETVKRFLDEYKRTGGDTSAACRNAGINRDTFYDWRDHRPEFARLVANANEDIKDADEAALLGIARDKKDPDRYKALSKRLDARAKDRGYGVSRADLTTGGEKLPPCKIVWIENAKEIPDGYEY